MKYLIIGNGIAGVSAAEAIRRMDATGEIVMVSDEKDLPYSRPMITHLLEGSCTPDQLPIRSPDFYKNLNITPILGHRVKTLDAEKRTVTLTSGKTLGYHRLLIASGADPRPVRAEGSHLKNIFYMRTGEQARQQLACLPGVRRAVVLGGGLVGFKSACALQKQGIRVTLIITSPYPLSMQVDEFAGKMLLREMLAHGFEIKVGASVTAFESDTEQAPTPEASKSGSSRTAPLPHSPDDMQNERVASVLLDTGERIPCDLVIAGKGVLPAHTFVPRKQIEVDLGIRVNGRMETSAPHVYAAGDVAQCMDIARRIPWVNAIWPEAAIQGRIAGLNMAGRAVTHPGSLSRNVMRVFGMDVMTIGHVDAGACINKDFAPHSHGTPARKPDSDTGSGLQYFRTHDPTENYYRSLIFRGDILIGAVLINHIEQGGVIRALIERKAPVTVPLEMLLSPHFQVSKLLSGG